MTIDRERIGWKEKAVGRKAIHQKNDSNIKKVPGKTSWQ